MAGANLGSLGRLKPSLAFSGSGSPGGGTFTRRSYFSSMLPALTTFFWGSMPSKPLWTTYSMPSSSKASYHIWCMSGPRGVTGLGSGVTTLMLALIPAFLKLTPSTVASSYG